MIIALAVGGRSSRVVGKLESLTLDWLSRACGRRYVAASATATSSNSNGKSESESESWSWSESCKWQASGSRRADLTSRAGDLRLVISDLRRVSLAALVALAAGAA